MPVDFDNYQLGKEENHCQYFFFKYRSKVDKNIMATYTVIGDSNPSSNDKNDLYRHEPDWEETSSFINFNKILMMI